MVISDYTLDDFINAFVDYDRDNYSQEGYERLYEICTTQNPDDELDVIEICRNCTEYENLETIAADYGYGTSGTGNMIRELSDVAIIEELDNGGYLVFTF